MKLFIKWLVCSSLCLTCTMAEAALPIDPLVRKKCSVNEKLKDSLDVLLINQTVYFHDYAFGFLEVLPADFYIDDSFLLIQNAAAIGSTLFPNDQEKAYQLTSLLTGYISAGQEYVNIVGILGSTEDPVLTELLNGWLNAANQIALFLHEENGCVSLKKGQRILAEYTLLLASMVNALASTSESFPNFAGASQLYFEALEFSKLKLSPLFAKGF